MTLWKGKLSLLLSPCLDVLREYEPWCLLLVLHFIKLTLSLLNQLVLVPLWDKNVFQGGERERKLARDEGRTAQICDFWMFAQQSPCIGFGEVRLNHMLLTHHEYVSPYWIIGNEQAKIWDSDGEKVVFSVSEISTDLYDVRQHPFSFMNMPYLSRQILIMSFEDFHRVAKRIGHPKCQLSVVHMTARSGSTLLCQMMHRIPSTRVIAEPRIFWRLGYDSTRKDPQRSLREVKEIMKSSIRILCRPSNNNPCKHVFIKLVFFEASFIHLIPQMFPSAKLIFNTRMPTPSLKSFGKVFRSAATYPLSLRILDKLFPDKMSRTFPTPIPADYTFPVPLGRKDLQQKVSQIFTEMATPFQPEGHWETFSALFYFCSLQCFFAHKSCYKLVILYEDLCSNPHQTLEELFQLINEPLEHVENALKAMDRDSQNGLGGGVGQEKGYVAPNSVWELIGQFAKRMDTQVDLNTEENTFRALLNINN